MPGQGRVVYSDKLLLPDHDLEPQLGVLARGTMHWPLRGLKADKTTCMQLLSSNKDLAGGSMKSSGLQWSRSNALLRRPVRARS